MRTARPSGYIRRLVELGLKKGEEMMGSILARVFTLDVDGKPTLAFEARNHMEANELRRELWLRDDLSAQMSNGVPLCDANSKFSARLASPEEAKLFSESAKAAANSSDDLVLAYLVELDVETDEQSVDPGAFPPDRT